MAWRYVLYLIKVENVEEKIILELFDARTTQVETGGDCCNVCRTPKIPQPKMEDCTLKVCVIVQLMHEIGS